MKRSYLIAIIGVVLIGTGVVFVISARRGDDGTAASIAGSWQWTSMKETAPAAQSVVPNPEDYEITFNTDGTFNANIDCNQVSGTYQLDGDKLTLILGPSTLAECPPGSLYDIFVSNLAVVDGYALQNGMLTLRFGGGAGEMILNSAD